MLKVAIFVEGKGELVFVRSLICKLFEMEKISFSCFELVGTALRKARFQHKNEVADIHFQITNVGNDSRVSSIIIDEEKTLISQDFQVIIGLRDMFCQQYNNTSTIGIDPATEAKIRSSIEKNLARLQDRSRVSFYFSVMELESWYLAMYPILKKIDASLNKDLILEKLNIDLEKIDVETIYKPSNTLDKIYQLTGKSYDKTQSNAEALSNAFCISDIEAATSLAKNKSLRDFYDGLVRIKQL